jgi:Ca-activated chloride channel homolog
VSGRHRPAGPLGWHTLRAPLSVVAVVGLVAVTALAVRVMAADANGCSGGVRLVVAAAPEFAPAVEDAATAWADTNPEVNGKCIQVVVRPAEPADVAGSLATRGGGNIDVAARPAPTPDEADVPAVWIPDSTAWLNRVAAVDRTALGADPPSLAVSPVVFAVPASLAESLASSIGGGAEGLLKAALADAQQAIQQGTPPQLTMGVVDPRRDSASLAGAMVLRDAVVTDETKIPNLIAIYRLINKGRAADAAALQKAFGRGVKVAPMTEQAVLTFNRASPNSPLAAIRLPEGGPGLDYPFATLNGKPREVDGAATKFRNALVGYDYRDAFARHGFREVDGTAGKGFPTGPGINAEPAAASPLADPARVEEALGYWSAANAPSRAVSLIDTSSSLGVSMTSRTGASTTRLAVLQQASLTGLAMFNDTSSLWMWTFDDGSRELTPAMKLNEENRQFVQGAIQNLRPTNRSQSALYDAIRDAYKLLIDTHDPEVENRLIVFTDGRDSGSGIKSLEALNKALESIAVVTKPVEVTLIGVGPDVDMAELKDIARMTGGVAMQILDPADIQRVFLGALLE